MKKAFLGGLLAIAMAPVAAGRTALPPAAGGLPDVVSARRQAIDRRGTLLYGAGLPFDHFNPVTNEWNEASSLIVSRLFTINLSAGIEGDLAESHEVSADGRTYTLKLRRGVTWHDGKPFSSGDVLFTYRELMKPATRFGRRLNLGAVDRFEAPDSHTFVFHLKSPSPMFLMPLTEIGILPAHVFVGKDLNDDAVFDASPIGTGPYRLAERQPDELTFQANDGYFRGKPAIPRLVLRHIASDDERAEALVAGDIEITQVKPQHVPRLSSAGNLRVYRFRTGAWRGMPLNLRRPALQDRRVRQAIALALDRDQMVARGLDGMGQPAASPIPPVNWAFPADVRPPARDPARAAELLDQAGWRRGPAGIREKDGRPLELHLIVWKDEIFRRTCGDIVRQNLEPLGFNVRLALVDNVEYNRLAQNMGVEYDGFIGGWSGLIDPGDNLSKKYRTGGSQNVMGYSNPELDRILDEARGEADRGRAKQLYRRAVEIITEDAVFLPLAYPDYVFAATDRVSGLGDYTVDSWYEFTRFAYLLGKR